MNKISLLCIKGFLLTSTWYLSCNPMTPLSLEVVTYQLDANDYSNCPTPPIKPSKRDCPTPPLPTPPTSPVASPDSEKISRLLSATRVQEGPFGEHGIMMPKPLRPGNIQR